MKSAWLLAGSNALEISELVQREGGTLSGQYLEKYAFEFIPDITKMKDIIGNNKINDDLM